ncbi:MAG: mannosyltransferase family protein [Streptosporangiales bacterium]
MRRATDGWALALWVGSRLLVLFSAVVALGSAIVLSQHWLQWDAALLVEIARYGYEGNPNGNPDPGLPGFLPGVPLLLRLVHLVVPNWALAGLLISLVAGAVAMVALARLGDFEFLLAGGAPAQTARHGVGIRAVIFCVLSPYAVFLAVGYTEATFLAFALPAWLCARKEKWLAAGVLTALATTVRVTGLFLAIALVIMYIFERSHEEPGVHAAQRGSLLRTGGHACALALPAIPVVAFSVYLHGITGDWLAWLHAQEAGWGRTFTMPWDAFATTWQSAWSGPFMVAFRGELVAALVGVALCLLLLFRGRWAEFFYVGLQVGALVTSAYYLSVTRSTLLWWPLWLLLARASMRHGWLLPVYAVLATPLMAWYTARFVHGAWAG